MPKAANVDWNLAQVLYVSGASYRAIAEKVGVTEMSLRQRAHRYHWPALKTAALETVSQAVTNHTGKTLVQSSNEVRSSLAEEIAESVDVLRQIPIKPKLADLKERAGVVGELTAAGGKVFGWNVEQGNSLIVIGMVDRLDPDNIPPAIEVESANPHIAP